MKERPILFNDQMVRAILDGRKTVTRRVMKPQPDFLGSMVDPNTPFKTLDAGLHARITCPYGEPGDRLWVREAWAQINVAQAPGETWVVYRECDNRTDYGGPWKPSIHMRRRDSRILLEITSVRVERLQDISEKQALAEGVELEGEGVCFAGAPGTASDTPEESFKLLWELINGAGSWKANPWVWVVEFKRVTP
ncbi:hypothetical protein [Pseudomonas aeruginosa]|uniref:hypothetical protein n=1 Tax=Pseudomonas aeruginosa TaxID=287 RepID=UPI002E23B612|nr:hypothetical protein [Pseudomonas aeruginosa]